MAASAFTLYTVNQGSIDLSAGTYVMTLHTNSYTPAPNADDTWSDISATELSTAGGYTAGGAALSGVTLTSSGGTTTFDASDPSWASFSAGPFRYAVITKRAGGSLTGTDKLVCYSDLTGSGTITGVAGTTFSIAIDALGIGTFTHTP